MFRGGERVALVLIMTAALAAPSGRCAVADEGENDRLVELLELGPGMVAADVGAGEGQWTEVLARAVGPSGWIFATEVEQKLVDDLAARFEKSGHLNVTTVLGDQTTSGLTRECCNAILLRMVYHHFKEPTEMRRSLHEALKPDGLIAVVDIHPQKHWRQLEGVPERGGHGIEPEVLIREMRSEGFRLVSRHDDWNGDADRFCVLFRRGG